MVGDQQVGGDEHEFPGIDQRLIHDGDADQQQQDADVEGEPDIPAEGQAQPIADGDELCSAPKDR